VEGTPIAGKAAQPLRYGIEVLLPGTALVARVSNRKGVSRQAVRSVCDANDRDS
jgi:hypothetical protein